MTETEKAYEAVESWFKEGVTAAELDSDGRSPRTCPHTDAIASRWWTRGYASQVRLFRAITAEKALKEILKANSV